jgi:hypothetical protein
MADDVDRLRGRSVISGSSDMAAPDGRRDPDVLNKRDIDFFAYTEIPASSGARGRHRRGTPRDTESEPWPTYS